MFQTFVHVRACGFVSICVKAPNEVRKGLEQISWCDCACAVSVFISLTARQNSSCWRTWRLSSTCRASWTLRWGRGSTATTPTRPSEARRSRSVARRRRVRWGCGSAGCRCVCVCVCACVCVSCTCVRVSEKSSSAGLRLCCQVQFGIVSVLRGVKNARIEPKVKMWF